MGFITRRLLKQNLNLLDVFIEDENNSFFYLSGNLKELTDHTHGWIFLKSLLPKHQRELIKIELTLASLEKDS